MTDHRIRCDAFGCDESYPLDHEAVGEPDFPPGRWLGWLYLTIQADPLGWRELRFCSAACLSWWIDEVRKRAYRPGPLDKIIEEAQEKGELGPVHLRRELSKVKAAKR